MDNLRLGAIILCGGKSSRMGQSKHLLPFGTETVLQRVARSITSIADDVIVVASPDQEIPELPDSCRVICDDVQHQGPLSGLMYGLREVKQDIEAVFLSGCDCPLLKTEFIEAVASHLGGHEIAVPIEERFLHPLAGVYRTSVQQRVEELINSGERKPRALIESSDSIRIPVVELRSVDENLVSLLNMNTAEDYRQLLRLVGER